MSVDFKFNKIQLQRTRPEGFKFPIGLSSGFLTPTGNSATDTEGGLQRCLAGGAGTPGTVATGNTFHIFANPSGSGTFKPAFTGEVDVLVVGAGSGGASMGGGGGGGGGIAFAQNFPVVDDRDYTVVIGAGGAGATAPAPAGSDNGFGAGFNGTNCTFTDSVTGVSVLGFRGGAGGTRHGNSGDGAPNGRGSEGGSPGGSGAPNMPAPTGGFPSSFSQSSQNPGISGVSNFGNLGGGSNGASPSDIGPGPADPPVYSGGGGGGAGQEGGGVVFSPGPGGSYPGSSIVGNGIGFKAPAVNPGLGYSGGTGINFSGFAEAGVGTPGGFGLGIATQTNGFFGGGGGGGGWNDPASSRIVGSGGAGGGGGAPFASTTPNTSTEPGSTSPNGIGMANTGGGGRGGSGDGRGVYATSRSGSPSDADGAKAGGSGIVVIKYKTDAGSVEGFFIN